MMDISEMLQRRGRAVAEADHIAATMSDEMKEELTNAPPVEKAALLRSAVYRNHKSGEQDTEE